MHIYDELDYDELAFNIDKSQLHVVSESSPHSTRKVAMAAISNWHCRFIREASSQTRHLIVFGTYIEVTDD
jgi:hypothetical protein